MDHEQIYRQNLLKAKAFSDQSRRANLHSRSEQTLNRSSSRVCMWDKLMASRLLDRKLAS